ncbi:site-specific integrase [Bacillus subtilis]|uniref:site-specific integrase n=1 Tax=Bacillus subtilis TaxID=1423 RepID=UPI00157696A4|nr:site-specific integrase [Bacillus subtilis]NTU16273.1 site-specific integrase [Bacillus subtilis subsp. subtilis]
MEQIFESFLESVPYTYFTHLKAFKDYLRYLNVTDDTIIDFLQGVRTERIIDSLKFNIENRSQSKKKILKKETAYMYSVVIKKFFLYLQSEHCIKNLDFERELNLSASNHSSYRYKMNEFISNNSILKDSRGFNTLLEEEVNDLIKQCDETLNSDDIYINAFEEKRYFNKFRSAIIIKLIILTGVRYEIICNLKKNNLDLKYNNLKINDYSVPLPNNFRDQFEKYSKLVNELTFKKDNDFLLIEFEGEQLKKTTADTANFLKNSIDRSDLNGLIKYSVVNMLKHEMNEHVIRKLTGIGTKFYEQCLEEVVDLDKDNRHLNSIFMSMASFNTL